MNKTERFWQLAHHTLDRPRDLRFFLVMIKDSATGLWRPTLLLRVEKGEDGKVRGLCVLPVTEEEGLAMPTVKVLSTRIENFRPAITLEPRLAGLARTFILVSLSEEIAFKREYPEYSEAYQAWIKLWSEGISEEKISSPELFLGQAELLAKLRLNHPMGRSYAPAWWKIGRRGRRPVLLLDSPKDLVFTRGYEILVPAEGGSVEHVTGSELELAVLTERWKELFLTPAWASEALRLDSILAVLGLSIEERARYPLLGEILNEYRSSIKGWQAEWRSEGFSALPPEAWGLLGNDFQSNHG